MRKIIVLIVLLLAASSSAIAESPFPELDKIKQIKLLESTADDVKRIFSEFEASFKDKEAGEIRGDQISTKNLVIRFRYSLGNCADNAEEEWNVPKEIVTEINVIFRKSVAANDLKIDLAKLERIKENDETDENEAEPDDFIYYDKEKNASYGLSNGKIKNIKFTPAEKNFPALCNNETIRESGSNKEWLLTKLRDRPSNAVSTGFPNPGKLILSKNEFTIDCPTNDSGKTRNDFDYAKINVEARGGGRDVDNAVTYNYTVSGGTIVGTGANVVWDLSGVAPGKYTITTEFDNGCGICGTTFTEEVIVKEPVCPKK